MKAMPRTSTRTAASHRGSRMRRWTPGPRILAAVAGVALAATVGFALAQSSSANFSVPRQSVDGGAQRASSATYSVSGTVGQPDAGPAMSSTTFAVRGGFHVATAGGPLPDLIFANGFEP
jgi:hypothetical protein